jgi:hypothetical protein
MMYALEHSPHIALDITVKRICSNNGLSCSSIIRVHGISSTERTHDEHAERLSSIPYNSTGCAPPTISEGKVGIVTMKIRRAGTPGLGMLMCPASSLRTRIGGEVLSPLTLILLIKKSESWERLACRTLSLSLACSIQLPQRHGACFHCSSNLKHRRPYHNAPQSSYFISEVLAKTEERTAGNRIMEMTRPCTVEERTPNMVRKRDMVDEVRKELF